MDWAASLAPLNDVTRGSLDIKTRGFYFIKIFNTLLYLPEFKHKLTKAPISLFLSNAAVASVQQPHKSWQMIDLGTQVQPLRTESEGEGLGVLPR
jgi:hypothetical protein